MSKGDHIVPKGLEGYRLTDPLPDVPALLVGHACDTLLVVGAMLGRAQDADDTIAFIRTKFGG